MAKTPLTEEETVCRMAERQNTIEDIAYCLGISRDTIERKYRSQIDMGRAKGRAFLRDLQWQAAIQGNVAMLIFLGKQILGQSDTASVDSNYTLKTFQMSYARELKEGSSD